MEDSDVRRKNDIKMDIKDMLQEGVEWIRFAPDGDEWRAVVITVINLPFP